MYSQSPTGNLVIKPLTAKLKRDKDLFTKMDPYVRVIFGSQQHRTHTSWNSGKHPAWKDSMNFRRVGEDIITFEVWDKDILSRDDMCGVGTLSFQSILNSNNRLNEWIPLSYKGKNSGELLVDIIFIPEMPMNNMNMGIQYQQPYQQQYQQPLVQQPIYQQPPVFQQGFNQPGPGMNYQMPNYQQNTKMQPGNQYQYSQPQNQMQPNQQQFNPSQGKYGPYDPTY